MGCLILINNKNNIESNICVSKLLTFVTKTKIDAIKLAPALWNLRRGDYVVVV